MLVTRAALEATFGHEVAARLIADSAPESRVFAELAPMPAAPAPSDEPRLFGSRTELRVIGY